LEAAHSSGNRWSGACRRHGHHDLQSLSAVCNFACSNHSGCAANARAIVACTPGEHGAARNDASRGNTIRAACRVIHEACRIDANAHTFAHTIHNAGATGTCVIDALGTRAKRFDAGDSDARACACVIQSGSLGSFDIPCSNAAPCRIRAGFRRRDTASACSRSTRRTSD
jgi:hypothetical protein